MNIECAVRGPACKKYALHTQSLHMQHTRCMCARVCVNCMTLLEKAHIQCIRTNENQNIKKKVGAYNASLALQTLIS